MLAKKTSKNQITLPKGVADMFPGATYFDVSAEEERIVLVPVRRDRANMVRSKLADLGIEEPDVADAIAWARREWGTGRLYKPITVMSAPLFQQGRLAWMRGAWSAGAAVPLVCKETVEELLRVLAYPKFWLDRNEIDDLLGDFLPFAEVVDLASGDWPNCRDEDDRMFLALAEQARADLLITGDADLLGVAETFLVKILTPAALKEALGFGR